ncbi:MAG: Wzy polymerase domain-containing protein [Rubrivivax sp.]|jgi:O-antigen ligase|nr:Wzy polymerase domain-containing protein [Rubrivivax sp.]
MRQPATPRADAGPGWLLLAAAAALPWLLPIGGQPWPDFHNQALAAAVVVAVAGWAAWPRAAPWALPMSAGLCVLLAATAVAQALSGRLPDAGEAVLPVLYLLGTAAAIVVGLRAETLAPRRLPDALFGGIAMAALGSAVLALAQWLRVDLGLGLLAMPTGAHGRPAGNLGQPNLLATLLLWGLVGLWWAWAHMPRAGVPATLAAALMLVALAATQSRSGALGLLVLAAWAAAAPGARRPDRRLVAALVAAFTALWLAWPSLNESIALDAARSTAEVAQAGKRPQIWALAIAAIAERPWFGWGWGLGTVAHSELAPSRPPLHLIVAYMHNAVLDLAVWAGVPVALTAMAMTAVWLVRRATGARAAADDGDRAANWILLAPLLPLGSHAMLELPHVYAQFLMPAALLVGVVERRHRATTVTPWRATMPLALAMLAAALVLLVVDHGRLRTDVFAERVRAARIGNLPPGDPPRIVLLQALQRSLLAGRVEPRAGMDESQLAALDGAARRYASAGTQFKAAQAWVLNGRPDRARAMWARLCAMHPQAQCEAAAAAWRALAASQPALGTVEPPSAR